MINKFEKIEESYDSGPDLVCLSHLRWDFVFQRPQHLMSRCARERRVFFVEEPVFEPGRRKAALDLKMDPCGVCIATPKLAENLKANQIHKAQRRLIDRLFVKCAIQDCILWYYTPMALPFTKHIDPLVTVYDCMDELSGFRGAPPEIRKNESDLLLRANVVFTGGLSLYEARAHQHPNIHPFPSSIDSLHFARARDLAEVPEDERIISRPRIGFAGVIDERMDLNLVSELARLHPEWNLVLIGPIVKLKPEELPKAANIHYLGSKSYEVLPAYMAGWDVAIMPFAHNDSTRYISPTKTPEYLAAGRRVISTSIRDVARIYGTKGLVAIADTVEDFAAEIKNMLNHRPDPAWLDRVDRFLSLSSWDSTWNSMMRLIQNSIGSGLEESDEKYSAPSTWERTVVEEMSDV